MMHRVIPGLQMDMIRAIVNQLNIGFEVLERRDQFTIMENSTEDYCEVDVTFVHDSSEEDDDDDRDEHHDNEDGSVKQGEDFEIQFISTNNKLARTLDGKFRVQKMRDLKKCPRSTTYFFGIEADYSRGILEFCINMTNSTSHILMTKNKFKSLTTTAAITKTANQLHAIRLQNIVLKLKRIDLARNSLPVI